MDIDWSRKSYPGLVGRRRRSVCVQGETACEVGGRTTRGSRDVGEFPRPPPTEELQLGIRRGGRRASGTGRYTTRLSSYVARDTLESVPGPGETRVEGSRPLPRATLEVSSTDLRYRVTPRTSSTSYFDASLRTSIKSVVKERDSRERVKIDQKEWLRICRRSWGPSVGRKTRITSVREISLGHEWETTGVRRPMEEDTVTVLPSQGSTPTFEGTRSPGRNQ